MNQQPGQLEKSLGLISNEFLGGSGIPVEEFDKIYYNFLEPVNTCLSTLTDFEKGWAFDPTHQHFQQLFFTIKSILQIAEKEKQDIYKNFA